MDTFSSNGHDMASLNDPALDPLFWRPARLGVTSAWYGHVPFAHWLMATARPGCFVELGAHAGVSYAAFCDAALRARVDTRCFAIDTWQGDEHAGFYDNSVYDELSAFHERHYAGFSRLIRSTFDDALEFFADGSIDLLHIDGRHRYTDVSHDFASWERKLSRRAVVLFHDTNERVADFGVWRLWDELKSRHPSFEFLHSHGLGVLAYGEDAPQAVLALCRNADVERVRTRFTLLGERWEQDYLRVLRDADIVHLHGELDKLGEAITAAHEDARHRIEHERGRVEKQQEQFEQEKEMLLTRTAGLQYDVENLQNDLGHTMAELAFTQSQLSFTEGQLDFAQGQLTFAEGQLAFTQNESAWRESELAWLHAQVGMLQGERHIIMQSTAWRLVRRLTSLAQRVPRPLRRALRRSASLLRRAAQPTGTAPPPHAISPPVAPKILPAVNNPPALAAPPVELSIASSTAPPSASPMAQPAAKPKPTATPRPVAPVRRQPGQRIVFISGEPDTPGHDYRVLRAVHAAVMLGWQAEAMTIGAATNARLEGADLVVIWRATWSAEIDRIFDHCRKAGTVTIFDVDDLMFRPELARNKLIDGIRSQRLSELDVQRFYVRINQSVRAADLCTCTTAELASHLRLFKKPSFVVPNCWDEETWNRSRLAVRQRAQAGPDGLVRIGYASGTRTHQKDFAVVAGAIARVLREHPDCRLVLFRDPASGEGIVMIEEFAELADLHDQIEWRDKVALSDLAAELARFDINLAPLEIGNPFCEAKSELKHWEAALAGAPTVASPTGPYKRAIEHGRTGYLATTEDDWFTALSSLVADASLRRRVAHAAYLDVLWRFGPLHHAAAIGSMLDQARGGRPAARAMLLDLLQSQDSRALPHLPEREILFERDNLGQADVTVIVPVYNYAHYVREALDSVRAQTAPILDLVVIDDGSKDASLSVVLDWAAENADRFNRILVVRHAVNSGLGFGRNTGFDLAETPFVLPLDADNMLRPDAVAHLSSQLRRSAAAFAYPTIQRFGKDNLLIGDEPFLAARLVSGNFIDAMALVRRDAWAAAGGYDNVRFGWEDYDFWCRLVELGLWGEHVQEVLADYRAHEQSMLHTSTDVRENKIALIADLKRRHSWLDVGAMTLIAAPILFWKV
jgi:glycosyltransferase involved in cell wall biosynthesis